MTKGEFIEEYGEIVVALASYTNLMFHYCSVKLSNGMTVCIARGGSLEKLKNLTIPSGDRGRVVDLDPDMGYILNPNGEICRLFY